MATSPSPVDLLGYLLTCSFPSSLLPYLRHAAKHKYLMEKHNSRLWSSCRGNSSLCLLPQHLHQVCPLFPLRLAKTVRLRLGEAAPLLRDLAGLKVVLLVRDPRGVYNSRQSVPWCRSPQCTEPFLGCTDLLADLAAAEELGTRHPGSVAVLRYEDLARGGEVVARRLLDFLALPWRREVGRFLETHTVSEPPRMVRSRGGKLVARRDNYSTRRNSLAAAVAWRGQLSWERVGEVQQGCGQVMARLGYRRLGTEEQMLGEEEVVGGVDSRLRNIMI